MEGLLMKNYINTDNQYINEVNVSDMTGMSVATLRNHRWLGKGIPYIKIGRTVRYQESEVLEYLENLRVQTKPL